MNRAPLSQEPVNLSILLKMAYTDSFALGFASTFAGGAISEIRPESIILGFIGLVFLYFFISNYTDENEISVLKKNIKWFNAYSFVTYISVAIASFCIHFDQLAFFAIVVLFPALINAGLVRPFITVSIYRKNYIRLFGVFDA